MINHASFLIDGIRENMEEVKSGVGWADRRCVQVGGSDECSARGGIPHGQGVQAGDDNVQINAFIKKYIVRTGVAPPEAFKSRWKWILIGAGGIAAAIVIAIITAYSVGAGSSSSSLVSPSGAAVSASSVPPRSLSITNPKGYYQLVESIYNPTQEDEQVQRITLDVSWETAGNCSSEGTYTFNIGSNVLVAGSGERAASAVTPESGIGRGSAVSATGRIVDNCRGVEWTLNFSPPALTLSEKKTTYIVIYIPDVIARKSVSPDPGKAVALPSIFMPSGAPVAYYSSLEAKLTIYTDPSQQIYSCAVQSGVLTGKSYEQSCLRFFRGVVLILELDEDVEGLTVARLGVH
jgi:hypothetical protein